jgi:hypothetical protein
MVIQHHNLTVLSVFFCFLESCDPRPIPLQPDAVPSIIKASCSLCVKLEHLVTLQAASAR